MKEFVFRVLIDTVDDTDVFRDISIRSTDTFELLHRAIINAFSFEGGQMASFYMSDEEWNKGDEIGLLDMSGEDTGFQLMEQTIIGDRVEEIGQKLIYVYDFLNMWCFYVELNKINEVSSEKLYPNLELSFGNAPQESSKSIMDDLDFPTIDEDDYGIEDEFDEWESHQFENIDDLDI